MLPTSLRLLVLALLGWVALGADLPGKPEITLQGKQLLVDGKPFHAKGVCWNPVGFNKSHPTGQDFRGFVEQDADLMQAAGINVVRTYDPIDDTEVLDEFWKRGIWVVMNVYVFFQPEPSEAVEARIRAVMHHPSILFWEIGNEWNYNCLYDDKFENQTSKPCEGVFYREAMERVRQAGLIAKQTDPSRPVAHCFGELPNLTDPYKNDTFEYLDEAFDMIGINSYRSIDFTNLFDDYVSRTNKPMYMGEFGADAWDSRPEHNISNLSAQAEATRELTYQIHRQSSVHGGGPVVGQFIFEFADEWWKDKAGTADDHDVGGGAPGFGPWPDKDFNEEWWGILDIWRVPRPAYHEYAKIPNPMAVRQAECTVTPGLAPPAPAPPAPPPGLAEEVAFDWASFGIGGGIGGVMAGLFIIYMCREQQLQSTPGVELS